MSLEMRHLKVVAAIAEEGSVTRAGTRLHLTQSALSHQLRDAEEQLGRPLFERRNRKMTLTAAGERLLRSARAVMNELDQAERDIQCSSSETRGVLRLTTQCYTAYHWLASRLKGFQKKYPGVEVQLVPEATANPFEALLGEKLDLAITHAPARNRRIQYTPLFRDELVVIVAPGHTWAARPFVIAKDFATEDLIIYPPKKESTLLLQFLNPARISPRKIREVMLTEAIVGLVKARMGVAVVTKWSVAPQLASGELAAVRLTRDGFYREWSVAQRRSKSAPAYLDEFIRLLAQTPLNISDSQPRRADTARRRRAVASPSNTTKRKVPSARS
ncbi:MAG: LysR family transcriptional regulator [Candidatus Acidiferrales bacterium]